MAKYWVQKRIGQLFLPFSFLNKSFGGYSIDLAIRDPNDKSRYILAVECDGKAYHSSYSARANDRLRQEVLEGKGWNFFRIWSTDWNRDPISELNQLDKLVKKLSIK